MQVYGLSLSLMTEKIGIILGETIGEVEEVDAGGTNGLGKILTCESCY